MKNLIRNLSLKMPKNTDKPITICMVLLCIYGLFMILSASMGIAAVKNAYLFKIMIKQVVFIVFGFIGMCTLAKLFTLNFLEKHFANIICLTGFSLFICIFWKEVGGAKAWIRIPLGFVDMTIQPSEFAKITCILLIAYYFGDIKSMSKKIQPFDYCKTPFIILGTMIVFVAIFQSDFGSAMVMAAISAICFLVPQNRLISKYQRMLFVAMIFGLFFVLFLLSGPGTSLLKAIGGDSYKVGRFLSAADPFRDKYNQGYQIVYGLISFASGGLFGVGFGKSIRKYTNFPAANTDFILAIIVEELGIIGFLIILILYGTIVLRLFRYAFMIKNQKARIILVGTCMYFFIHFLFNVGGVTALIPLTGVPLLMISSGGSSTMSIMLCVGISQSIIKLYKQGVIE